MENTTEINEYGLAYDKSEDFPIFNFGLEDIDLPEPSLDNTNRDKNLFTNDNNVVLASTTKTQIATATATATAEENIDEHAQQNKLSKDTRIDDPASKERKRRENITRYFDILRSKIPTLKDKTKVSQVEILTELLKFITQLKKLNDKENK